MQGGGNVTSDVLFSARAPKLQEGGSRMRSAARGTAQEARGTRPFLPSALSLICKDLSTEGHAMLPN